MVRVLECVCEDGELSRLIRGRRGDEVTGVLAGALSKNAEDSAFLR